MSRAKKVVLYGVAILIALFISFDLGMSFVERLFLIVFLLVLMVLFMVVFTKQEESRKLREEREKQSEYEVLEEETKGRLCVYCDTLNREGATYCKKCKRSLKDVICPVCGHKNSYDQKYCEQCESILQNKKVHL